MALPDFNWLKETAGSYIDPAIANGAKNIQAALDKITRNRKGFSLDKVMANVKNDFARPNLFEVSIDKVKGSLIIIFCCEKQSRLIILI